MEFRGPAETGHNRSEIRIPGGARVFFSYSTAVAGYDPTRSGQKWIRTSEWHSVTTTRHINEYLEGIKADTVGPAYFEDLFTKVVKS